MPMSMPHCYPHLVPRIHPRPGFSKNPRMSLHLLKQAHLICKAVMA
jgi:hypothetical protein